MATIEELTKELWEASDEELLERVRWLDRDLWGNAVKVDPALGQRYRETKAAFIERKKVEFAAAERPLVEDLCRAGFSVSSVYDLVNTSSHYEAAIPVLLAHATRAYPDVIREGIYRSLGTRAARALAWDDVLRAYIAEPNESHIAAPGEIGAPSGPKEGMANALSEMANPGDLPTLIRLITEPKNGRSRIFFIPNLARSRSPLAFDTLASLSSDPELAAEIAHTLKSKMRRQAKKDGRRWARH